MKITKQLLMSASIILAMLITSCADDEVNLPPGNVTLTSPTNNSTEAPLNTELTWQAVTDPDGDTVLYDVYFGTEATPVTAVSTNQSETSFAPTLKSNTMYYWMIVAKDDKGGESESDTWSFTTLNNAPGPVTLTAPTDAASDVSLDASLTWGAAIDPDGDTVTYDVYFGKDEIPTAIVSTDQSELSYTPTFEAGNTYYWKVVAKDPNGGVSESAVWSFSRFIQIGDFYQGGVVFYLDETGKHGLVCPIMDQSSLPETHQGWSCTGSVDIPGADGTAIGTGLQNTLDIIAACDTKGIAAEICASLSLNGYDDWYLPSINEQKEMYKRRNVINAYALANGGEAFVKFYYYSSSESDINVLVYHFKDQTVVPNLVGKGNYNFPFRAVRSF